MKPFDPKLNHKVLMPEGAYQVYVAHAYERVSRNGNPYITLGLKVTDGERRNRVIFRNFFIDGDAESYAVQRSSEELAAICRATGYDEVLTDPQQLITGVEFPVTVQHYTSASGVPEEALRIN
ncbi:DUF669 domain-containing protein [Pasteurella testudinis]|uniref:DUF669 domain-containing protein n=1 Tax=Pasteurella testudinis TaxID=761 RepID=UPI004059360E